MGLDLPGLKTNLKELYDATLVASVDAETAETNFINGLATAIDTYVRSASIVYTEGLTAPGGPVTGDFIGGLE
ncbi:hypothetical protein [uncultured Mucilaginibacter sp.]|uniref:hypothetical protein n=1 Tax=uncultured Mucilaginibacter sp. TaxID=797541 RepID=UPI0025ED81B9|nr:hypothetical protein [uncultured Mucilaginibacter sp.]